MTVLLIVLTFVAMAAALGIVERHRRHHLGGMDRWP